MENAHFGQVTVLCYVLCSDMSNICGRAGLIQGSMSDFLSFLLLLSAAGGLCDAMYCTISYFAVTCCI